MPTHTPRSHPTIPTKRKKKAPTTVISCKDYTRLDTRCTTKPHALLLEVNGSFYLA